LIISGIEVRFAIVIVVLSLGAKDDDDDDDDSEFEVDRNITGDSVGGSTMLNVDANSIADDDDDVNNDAAAGTEAVDADGTGTGGAPLVDDEIIPEN